jgi:UDP-N-acetylglucosamine 2-epimerase (non-hydrolysing)
MKVVTILGTRPEIIRLSRVIPTLDSLCEHVLVHTGQNFEPGLTDVFFKELRLRNPDHSLDCGNGGAMEQIGRILVECERVLRREDPDRVLILGDTNSGLSAFVAKRLGVPVYHMEAGNRCHDDRVPEEVNRRVIDQCSDVLLPYTRRSASNLHREGFPPERVFVTGNPIREVLDAYETEIDASGILSALGLRSREYLLVTVHRAENVDDPGRVQSILEALSCLHREFGRPVVWPVHPRTRSRIRDAASLEPFQAIDPLGLFDFVHLERNALCVLTDSGTVQEECCLLRIPSVTLRDVTERPETLEAGSTVLSGVDPERIVRCARAVLAKPVDWTPYPELLATNVSTTVAKLLLGYRRESM